MKLQIKQHENILANVILVCLDADVVLTPQYHLLHRLPTVL